MSGKAGSIGSIVLGAVIIVAGLFTYGATWAALPAVLGGALTMAGGVIGLAFQPKNITQESAKAQDLQFASAGEGFPVPVIFGEQKVIPNFMNWNASTFRSVEGSVAVGGKGGGGTTQPNGVIDYYLTFELGLCMGPIDEIGQVISVPGDALCRGSYYSSGTGLYATKSGVTVTTNVSMAISGVNPIAAGATVVWQDGTRDVITAVTTFFTFRVASGGTKTSQRISVINQIDNIVFDGSSDYEELTLSGVNEGGLVRVYRGTEDQERISATDPYYDTGMNYRNVCWALHYDFWINRGTPTPKTYQYIIRRLPRCERDNLTTVEEIETRGSIDPTHPSYYQANPAAVVYEIITNKLWGRKESSDLIDEASFIATSQYFKAKNIGISFTLDSPEKLGSILDGLRMQLKLILTWKNGTYKMRCLLDPQETSETILTLTSDDVEGLRVMRPLWPSTTNEVRAEFNSRDKLYKGDVVHVQNQANIELTGRVNSASSTLRSFTDFNLANKMATRILMEASYPAAMATFYINRFKSNLEIGDCVRIIWKEWGENTVTAYFLINRLEPQGKSDDRIKVTAVEDVFLAPVTGEETTVALPFAQAWEKIAELTEGDLSQFERPTSQAGAIDPITALEMPAMFDIPGTSWISIFGVRPTSGTIGAQIFWAPENTNTFTQVNGILDFAIPLTLTTSILHSRYTDRSSSFVEFVVRPEDVSTLLAVSTIQSDADHLEAVDSLDGNYMIIGEEIIKVGRIQQVSGSVYKATSVVRGCFGSQVLPHVSGTQAFFRQTISKGIEVGSISSYQDYVLKLKAYPVTAAGPNQVGEPFYIFHEGTNNQQLMSMRDRPYPAEFIDCVQVGSNVYLTLRPRMAATGAQSRPLIGQYNPATDLTNGVLKETRAEGGNSFYDPATNSDYSSVTTSIIQNANGSVTFTFSSYGAPISYLKLLTRGEYNNRLSVFTSEINVRQ